MENKIRKGYINLIRAQGEKNAMILSKVKNLTEGIPIEIQLEL